MGTGPQTPTHQLLPHEAHHYLGIDLTTDGNYQKELATYQQRQNKYISLLQNCAFPLCEVQVIYNQCYLPMVGYPLPATIIPVTKLNIQQGLPTTIFLTKMGYSQSFPRTVAYAPKDHGGMGLWLFGTEQGLHKFYKSSNTYGPRPQVSERSMILYSKTINSCPAYHNQYYKTQGPYHGAMHHGLTPPSNSYILSRARSS